MLSALALALQTRSLLRCKSSVELSLAWMSIYAVGGAIWTAYGVSIASMPLIASSAVAMLFSMINTGLAIRYRLRAVVAAPCEEPRSAHGTLPDALLAQTIIGKIL
jgi:uncharacterized protein with PQ loop repeat